MALNEEDILRRYAAAAEAAHAELTELDQLSGDGDFGDNLRNGLRDAVSAYEKSGGSALRVLGEVFLDEVGGTSGPLLGLLFTEIARAHEEPATARAQGEQATTREHEEQVTAHAQEEPATDPAAAWAAGTAAGLAAIQRVGEAAVGDRTLVDALAPAVEALRRGGENVFSAAAEAAGDGAARTAEMRARMGRASYVGDRAKGAPDPGAMGVALLFWVVATVADPRADLRPPLASV
ncbi:DAK2 domain-containing protein [Nonomuraea sp. NPDC050404]|uniref:DAK2 domain-containing protein n=1 Tax=Nonomuraea sp. NPDC050404 TaxID=3155783 RepID=UPI0033E9D5C8